MSQREAFEAWFRRAVNPSSPMEWSDLLGQYRSMLLEDRWQTWQASRAAALESAAMICDEVPKRHGVHSNFIAATLIRKLKDES